MDQSLNERTLHASAETSIRPESANGGHSDPRTSQKFTLLQKCSGKIHAVGILTEFLHHFSNWREVWLAHRSGIEFPDLRLRTGLTLTHGEGDQPLFSYREVFKEQPYTSGRFYRPRRGDTVLDLGANIGFFAVYLEGRARGIAVHCFEPAAVSRARLQRNVTINGLNSYVSVYPYALSDKQGIVHLSQHVHTIERSLVREVKDMAGAEPVESITLARALELCAVENVDLLKMDIEGAELEVVLGSKAADWKRIRRVAMEYHGNLRPGCFEKLAVALRERGFVHIRSVPSPYVISQGILQAAR